MACHSSIYYRLRAEEFRVCAELLTETECRSAVRRAADDYDWLAGQLEVIEQLESEPAQSVAKLLYFPTERRGVWPNERR